MSDLCCRLRRWFEGQGAVLSSARVHSVRRSVSLRQATGDSSLDSILQLPENSDIQWGESGGAHPPNRSGLACAVPHGSGQPVAPHLTQNAAFIPPHLSSDVYEDDSVGIQALPRGRAQPGVVGGPRRPPSISLSHIIAPSVSDSDVVPSGYEDRDFGDHADDDDPLL